MDINKRIAQVKTVLRKYRFPALILFVGIMLMMVPSMSELPTKEEPAVDIEVPTEEVLADLLSKIEGAGKVEVLLSIESGEETIFQTDEDYSQTDTSTTSKITTITVTESDRNEKGLIKQINPPKYLGAIVICQGADSAGVRLSIVDAVSKLTGLGADCISVLKMK